MYRIPLLLLLLFSACTPETGSLYERLKSYSDEIQVINTHEHQRWCEENATLEYQLSHLIGAAYLVADVNSAGGSGSNLLNWTA